MSRNLLGGLRTILSPTTRTCPKDQETKEHHTWAKKATPTGQLSFKHVSLRYNNQFLQAHAQMEKGPESSHCAAVFMTCGFKASRDPMAQSALDAPGGTQSGAPKAFEQLQGDLPLGVLRLARPSDQVGSSLPFFRKDCSRKSCDVVDLTFSIPWRWVRMAHGQFPTAAG